MKAEELASLRSLYLLAVDDPETDLQDLIDSYWIEIFEEELAGWARDESLWPLNRTAHTFRDWFHVETIDRVTDVDPHEPITLDEVMRTRCAMCDGLLDERQIALVLRGESCERWTSAQLDAWEGEQEKTVAGEAEEPPVTVLFRCCGVECATRAETAMATAAASDETTE